MRLRRSDTDFTCLPPATTKLQLQRINIRDQTTDDACRTRNSSLLLHLCHDDQAWCSPFCVSHRCCCSTSGWWLCGGVGERVGFSCGGGERHTPATRTTRLYFVTLTDGPFPEYFRIIYYYYTNHTLNIYYYMCVWAKAWLLFIISRRASLNCQFQEKINFERSLSQKILLTFIIRFCVRSGHILILAETRGRKSFCK